MTLSQYLRKNDLTFPIRLIIKSIYSNMVVDDDYTEIIILDHKKADDNLDLYRIQFITGSQQVSQNEVRWVSASWCADREVEYIF